jgi:hypothetical protein
MSKIQQGLWIRQKACLLKLGFELRIFCSLYLKLTGYGETSLNRWTGVTLFYSNAWWNRDRQCWVDEKFHVLDNVRLYHRRRGRAATAFGDDDSHQRSTFVWNEVLFDSFRAGNLKCLDCEFYRDLENATAKRLYRKHYLRPLPDRTAAPRPAT